MSNFSKLLLSLVLLAISTNSFTQSYSTFSPYSRYGIGEVRNQGYANTRAMGGITQGIRNGAWVNYLNPASYTAQDTMSFIFDFGLEGLGVNYQSGDQNNFNSTANIHHIAIQLPLGRKVAASAGIQPYSNVGYRIRHTETDPFILSSIGPIKYYHDGQGGITQLYVGGAYEPFKNFSIGANMSYLFGSLEYSSETEFPSYATPYNNFKKLTSIVVRDVAFSFGTQYALYLGAEKEYRVVLGATIDNETSIGARNITFISYPSGAQTDTIYFNEYPKGGIDFPMNTSAGFTVSYKNRFMAGFDYSYQDWSNAKFLGSETNLTASETFRAGVQVIPNPQDLRSYLNRISYRAGVYYSNTYLQIRDNQIKDYGISFGVGLPFRRSNTSFNFSYEIGSRGSLNDNLVRETYGIVNVGFTFYDIWFVKRKFN